VICGNVCVSSNLNNFIIRTQACGFQVERYNQAIFTPRWQVFFCRRTYNISHCLLKQTLISTWYFLRKIIQGLHTTMFLLSLSSAPQMSRNIPVIVGCLFDKAAVLRQLYHQKKCQCLMGSRE